MDGPGSENQASSNAEVRRSFLQLACFLVLLGHVSAETDWWSWQALDTSETSFDSIDDFIAAWWKERGLHGSPEASKRTLVRRLYVNVIGLPPSYEEVEACLLYTSDAADE